MTKTKIGAEHIDPAVPIQNVIPVAIGPHIAPHARCSSRRWRLCFVSLPIHDCTVAVRIAMR